MSSLFFSCKQFKNSKLVYYGDKCEKTKELDSVEPIGGESDNLTLIGVTAGVGAASSCLSRWPSSVSAGKFTSRRNSWKGRGVVVQSSDFDRNYMKKSKYFVAISQFCCLFYWLTVSSHHLKNSSSYNKTSWKLKNVSNHVTLHFNFVNLQPLIIRKSNI